MSDLCQGIAGIMSQASGFSSETRLYELDTPLPHTLLVESLVGKEELSALYEYHVNCLSSDTHIELKRLLGQQVTLRTRLADDTQGTRTGYVSAVSQLGGDGGFARYRLTLVPWFWMATQRRTSRVFQHKSVLHILEEVLAADAPRHNWRMTKEAEAFLSHTRPRSYCCQYLTGSPFDQLDALGLDDTSGQCRFSLTGLLHAGINNLPTGLTKDIDSRLGPAPAFDEDPGQTGDLATDYLHPSAWDDLLAAADATGYANRFTAIRADIPWRPALTDGTGLLLNPRPTAWGAQTATVVGADGSTAQAGIVHTDRLGRIRIRYPWQQDERNTCWVRVAQMYAGLGYGAQFIPRIGQEVIVKFLDNEIDRPIVTGVLYNGQGQDNAEAYAAAGDHRPAAQVNKIGIGASPAWHGAAGEHKHAGYLSGFKSVAPGRRRLHTPKQPTGVR